MYSLYAPSPPSINIACAPVTTPTISRGYSRSSRRYSRSSRRYCRSSRRYCRRSRSSRASHVTLPGRRDRDFIFRNVRRCRAGQTVATVLVLKLSSYSPTSLLILSCSCYTPASILLLSCFCLLLLSCLSLATLLFSPCYSPVPLLFMAAIVV